jgi:hypothetical protein
VHVYVFDKDGEQVSFQVSGATYTAAPDGDEYVTLTPEAPSVTVRLPAGGNPYRFEGLGEAGGSVVAYDSKEATIGTGTEVALALDSVIGDAVLVPRLPVSTVAPGQVLDLMLVVMANGHTDFPGDYLQVPIDDFTVSYGPVANATVLASSPRGLRLQVDAYCYDSVTVGGGVAGLVVDGGSFAPGNVEFGDGDGFEVPCQSSSGGLSLDMVPPSVAVTSYDPFTGVVTGEASDDVGVARVELYDGPFLLATTELADATGDVALIEFEPLSHAFATTLEVLPLGRVTAVAVDTSGNEAQSEAFLPGSVVYVDASAPAGGDGSAAHPYRSVQAGINAVAPGGTVFVRDGDYTETQLNVYKPLTLAGESEAGVVIQVTTVEYGVKLHADDVTLANLTILAAPSGAAGNKHHARRHQRRHHHRPAHRGRHGEGLQPVRDRPVARRRRGVAQRYGRRHRQARRWHRHRRLAQHHPGGRSHDGQRLGRRGPLGHRQGALLQRHQRVHRRHQHVRGASRRVQRAQVRRGRGRSRPTEAGGLHPRGQEP